MLSNTSIEVDGQKTTNACSYDFGTFAKYQSRHPSESFMLTISAGLIWIKAEIRDKHVHLQAVRH